MLVSKWNFSPPRNSQQNPWFNTKPALANHQPAILSCAQPSLWSMSSGELVAVTLLFWHLEPWKGCSSTFTLGWNFASLPTQLFVKDVVGYSSWQIFPWSRGTRGPCIALLTWFFSLRYVEGSLSLRSLGMAVCLGLWTIATKKRWPEGSLVKNSFGILAWPRASANIAGIQKSFEKWPYQYRSGVSAHWQQDRFIHIENPQHVKPDSWPAQ